MATFSLGIPVGSLMGMIIRGLVADSFGWRSAFLIVGLPRVVLGLIALFARFLLGALRIVVSAALAPHGCVSYIVSQGDVYDPVLGPRC